MPQKKPTPRPAPDRLQQVDRLLRDPYENETPEEWLRRTQREKRESELYNEYLSGGKSRGYASGMYGEPRGPETEFIQSRDNTLNALYAMLTGQGAPRGFLSNLDKYSRGK